MSSFRIRISNFIWIFINLFLLFVLMCIKEAFSDIGKESHIKLLAILGSVTILFSLYMIKRVRGEFDCYSILLCLSYVFMFGQHILYLINLYPKSMIILTNRVSEQAMYNTGFLILYSQIMMNVGYLFCGIRVKYEDLRNTQLEEIHITEGRRIAVYKTGLIFFLVSFIPTIITLVTNVYLTFTVGYGERMINAMYRQSGITNIASILSGLMIPSLLALFIARRKKQKWPIIAIAVYMILYTLSGSRINTMILLVGVLYVQNSFFEAINFKKIIKYALLLAIVIGVFSFVSIARAGIGINGDAKSVLSSSIDSIIENNPIVSAVSEAGYTFEATATVVDNCPNSVEYNYGRSYLSGLLYILPNGITNNYYEIAKSTDDVFKGYINTYGGGIGSSYIAEAYWNFGYYSLIIMFVFGLFVGRLNVSLKKAISTKNYIKIYMCIYCFECIAFYVRSDTRTFYRNYVWFCLPLVIIYKTLVSKTISNLENKHEKGIS